jgi:uncharacterized protein (DUF1810 family)
MGSGGYRLPDPSERDSLERFVRAQAHDYAQALAELRQGRKRTHWIWYVLPQLRGLGRSPLADHYGIAGEQEATAYLAHPLLGPRLRECVEAVLSHADKHPADIFGAVDALKFHSCLSLFAAVAPQELLFSSALHRFYAGHADANTQRLLGFAHG